MQLRNASAELQGINEPLHIVSAQTTIANQTVNVSALSGTFGATTAIGGSVSFPLHCTTPETCAIHFDLHSSELSLARVNQLLNPAARSQPWYHLLAIGQQQPDTLLEASR